MGRINHYYCMVKETFGATPTLNRAVYLDDSKPLQYGLKALTVNSLVVWIDEQGSSKPLSFIDDRRAAAVCSETVCWRGSKICSD
eukprot:1540623-Pleurochrysis_carterae.AAC.1